MAEKGRTKFVVLETDGVSPKQYTCSRRYAYNGGLVYEYQNEDNQTDLVLVPHKYQYAQEDGVCYIGKNKGNASAAILIGKGALLVGRSSDPNAPGEDLAILARTHVASRGYKTLYENQMPWKWLLIGIAVVLVIAVVVWAVKSGAIATNA